MITVCIEIQADGEPRQTIFQTSGGDAEHPQLGSHTAAVERARAFLAGVVEAKDVLAWEEAHPLAAAVGGDNAHGPAKATPGPKHLSIGEFRRLGFLQEANRLFFHPLGLALEVVLEEDGNERLGGIWDCRNDAQGVMFVDPPDPAKASIVAAEWLRHAGVRRALFGEVAQPLGLGAAGVLADLPRMEA